MSGGGFYQKADLERLRGDQSQRKPKVAFVTAEEQHQATFTRVAGIVSAQGRIETREVFSATGGDCFLEETLRGARVVVFGKRVSTTGEDFDALRLEQRVVEYTDRSKIVRLCPSIEGSSEELATAVMQAINGKN